MDPKTAAGTISHRGGLRFTAGKTTLGVQDFVIAMTKGVLTARMRHEDAHPDAQPRHGQGEDLVVEGLRARRVQRAGDAHLEAAAALNKTFKVSLFKGGLLIGTTKTTATF